jgi:hypothetical protein
VDRRRLLEEILAARPEPGDAVTIERRGASYRWRLDRAATGAPIPGPDPADPPDAWMTYTGSWPLDDPDRMAPFFEDLLAELDSMTGSGDRCRWPLDDPWPHRH